MFRKANTLLFFVALLANLVFGQRAESPTQSGKIWAVVVGVSKYQKLPGGQQLQFADKDATLFADAIQRRGAGTYNVRLLTGSEATVSAVKSAVGTWLAHSASPNDTVIIFFSGHGYFEKEFGESYLLCSDSDVKDPFATGLAIGELRQALTRLRANRVLVLADPIRRDFFDPDVDPSAAKSFLQAFEQMSTARHGLSAILANGAGEFSREGQRWAGHGAFAKHLADVLSEAADRNNDGLQTADEVFDLLASRVSADTSNKQHIWRSGAPLDQMALGRIDRQPATAGAVGRPQTEITEEKKSTSTSSQSNPTTSASVTAGEKRTVPDRQQQPARSDDTSKQTGDPKAKASPASTENRSATNSAAVNTADKGTPSTNPSKPAISSSSGKPLEASKNASPNSTKAASSPPKKRSANPPATEANQSASHIGPSIDPGPPKGEGPIAISKGPPAPEPPRRPPSTTVSSDNPTNQPTPLAESVPSLRRDAAPSPLVLQIEVAINSKRLIEPRNSNAWDLYQRLVSESGASSELARLKPLLAAAFIEEGKTVITGDVRGDNIADQVDSFKRAGQLLARARSLAPERADTAPLEKLSAAEALISLQFYDEAEHALGLLQDSKLAAVDNALGLVYQGKLDAWRAERAFKRASDLDSKWAAPHYNLALLYRSQQNQDSLVEFERAASLAPDNVAMVAALGEEYFTRQQFKEASEAYRKAVLLKPTDDTLHTKLGHALYSQGLQDEANREYQKAKELRGRHP